jgi:hypothetical protein
MYKRKGIALTILILTLAACKRFTAQKDLCPLEDEAFCAFTQEVETALISGEIDDFMNLFILRDCKRYGGGPYGPVEDDFCGFDEWCVREGVLQGEGSCIPLSEAMSKWGRFLNPPITIRGFAYDLTMQFPPEDSFNQEQPGIVIETYDPEWDIILLTDKDEDDWKIFELLLQRKVGSRLKTPLASIIPWNWSYEDNVFYWYGMTIPLDEWRAGSGTGDPESYGVLENRSISGCRFRIMHDVYPYLEEFSTELEFSRVHQETENLSIWIYTASDEMKNPAIAYFDVEDKTGSRGPGLFRIAYLLVEADEDIEACTGSVYELLLTMLPERFPELKIPQG